MQFTFSKRLITAGLLDGFSPMKEQKNYRVFDGEKLVGEFCYTSKGGLFTCGGRKSILRVRHRWPMMPKVSLIDQQSGEQIGRYHLTYMRGPGLFKGNSDELIMGETTYRFRSLTTGSHYKFSLANETETIVYTFRIDFPRGFSLGNITPQLPFEGLIDFNSQNLDVLFAGFYLMEYAFDEEGM